MGTRLRVELSAPDRAVGIAVIEEVFRVVEDVEEILSDFHLDAELARVNAAAAGVHLPLSEALTRMLSEAFLWSERTEGAFDPVIGSLVAAWDLRGIGRAPPHQELQRARASAGRNAVAFDPVNRTLLRGTPGARLDAGGFGKGEALRAATGRLRELGVESASMDFGGQVHVVGAGPDDSSWRVGVAHPFDRSVQVAELMLRDASASTSGPSERGTRVDGRPVSHHIDPRTGRPVEAWGSVTVVALDPFVADALSTALYVMGPTEGMRWVQGMDDVGALFLTLDAEGALRARMSDGMERWWVGEAFAGTLEKP
jgi:thiamine biosynthesis lipoprotein